MLDAIVNWDRLFTVWINGFHSPFFDDFFFIYTQMWVWLPFYALYLVFLFKSNKKQSFWIVLSIGLTILLSDQISSGILKPLVERWRPSRDPELQDIIHIVNEYRGGKFGFTSSHASNTFAIATLLMLYMRDKYQCVLLTLWALVTGYTRIYLGVHFFGDVFCGSIIGVLCGLLVYQLFKKRFIPIDDQTLLNGTSYLVFLLSLLIFCFV